MRGLADSYAFRGPASGGFSSDDDGPGGDPDADLQRCVCPVMGASHRSQKSEPSAHCVFGIVLAGARISEIDQKPIIEVTSHVAMVSLDDLSAGFVANRRCDSR